VNFLTWTTLILFFGQIKRLIGHRHHLGKCDFVSE
jgi:hypothetical protein